jgi:ATP synthase protein I
VSVPPNSNRDNQQFAMAMELPLIIVAAIGITGLLGFFLDRWLHTKPIFMILLGAVGFAIGVRDVLRRLPDK